MAREYKNRKMTDSVSGAAAEMGNVPPSAPDVEDAVLGAMLIDEDCACQGLELLGEKSFHNPRGRMVFRAVSDLFKERSPIDIMTVTERLRHNGCLEETGGAAHLASLTQKVGSAANFEYYVRILQQKTIQRDLIGAAYDILRSAFDPACDVDTLMQDAQDGVFQAVQGNRRGGYVQVGDAVNRSLERIQQLQKTGGGVSGIPSGFPSLDAFTMGWQPGNLIVIGARPSVGKTALALNMARNAAVDYGFPTAFFSLEMNDIELADRLIAAETGIPSDKLKGKYKLSAPEWTQIESTLTRLVSAPLYIDETSGLHITEFKTKAMRLVKERGVRIVFVDYLQLMEATVNASGGAGQVQKITEISKQLKAAAKELRVPIIALSQLNRNPMGRVGGNGRPILSDLKDSGSIEQDADMVLFVHRPGMLGLDDSPEAYSKAEIIIAKHRAGKVGSIEMSFNGDQVRFIDMVNSLEGFANRIETKPVKPARGNTYGGDRERTDGTAGEYNPFEWMNESEFNPR